MILQFKLHLILIIGDNIHPCNLTLPQDLKLFRVGRKISSKPRPLKVVLQSKEMALNLVSIFNSHKRTQSVPANSISISRDRTLLERQEIRRVYTELENRKKNGEHNISIKYSRGRQPVARIAILCGPLSINFFLFIYFFQYYTIFYYVFFYYYYYV